MIEKILQRFGYEKQSRLGEIIGNKVDEYFNSGYGKPQPENFEKYLKAYGDELWVYACVYTVSNTVASLPWIVYKKRVDRNGKITKEIINDNPAIMLLNTPNKNDENSTWYNIIEFTVASMMLAGNAYWLNDEMDGGGKPGSLQYLISSRVTIEPGEKSGEYIKSYIYTLPGVTAKKIHYLADEISHFKNISVNDYFYGQPSLAPARWDIDTFKEAIKTNLNIFKNGARLDAVLQTEQALNDTVYKRLDETFKQRYSGSDKAHKTPILEKGLEYKVVGNTLKDLEFIEGIKLTREDICAAFGVPPMLVGILDKATYSNYSESVKIFYQNTIIPKLKKMQPVIQNIVERFDTALNFEFDLSGIPALKEDEKLRSEIAKNYFSMGIPVNEIIDKLNLPFEHIQGGDTGYLPLALMPVSSAQRTQEPITPALNLEQLGAVIKSIPDNKAKYTSERKDALWKAFDTLTSKITDSYKKIIDKHFKVLCNETIAKLNKSKSIKAEVDIEAVLFNKDDEIKKWQKITKVIREIALVENAKRELLNLGVPIDFDVNNPRVQEWIKVNGLENATEVIGTLRDDIKLSLAEGTEAGESIPDLANRITDIFTPYAEDQWKAERIARTEVISASNQGALESYRQSGVVESKGWLATRDDRTRDTHLQAEDEYIDGIPIGEEFKVGSDTMLAPGQGNEPEENINCRCSLIPIIKENPQEEQ